MSDPEAGTAKEVDGEGSGKEHAPSSSRLKSKEKVSVKDDGVRGQEEDIYKGIEIEFGPEDWGGDVVASPTRLPSPTTRESLPELSSPTPQASSAHSSG